MFICDRGTGAQQFRGLVMREIPRPPSLGNDRRPSEKTGTVEMLLVLRLCPRSSLLTTRKFRQLVHPLVYPMTTSLIVSLRNANETVQSQSRLQIFHNFLF